MRPAATLHVLVDVKDAKALKDLTTFQQALKGTATQSQKNVKGLGDLRGGMKAVGDETDKTTKKTDRSTISFSKLGGAVVSTNQGLALMQRSLALIKWPGLIAGAGFAAQGLTAAAGAAAALAGALAPLAGFAAAATAGMVTMGQVKLVGALSGIKEITSALGGLNEKLDTSSDAFKNMTPAAQQFALKLEALKKPIREIQKSVQKELFAGLTVGIDRAKAALPALQAVLTGTASALGKIGAKVGKFIGGEQFSKDFRKIGKTNNQVLASMGKVAVSLGKAFLDVQVAARPLVKWVGKLGVELSQSLAQFTQKQRESGGLSVFFKQARIVAEDLVEIFGNVGKAIFRVMKLGQPLGKEIIDRIAKASKFLDTFTKSTEGQNKIRQFFEDIRPAVMEVGKLLIALGKGFFQLQSTGAGSLAEIIRQVRIELLPLLITLIRDTQAAFGPRLVNLLVSVTKLFAQLAGTSGPLNAWADAMTKIVDIFTWMLEKIPLFKELVTTLIGFKAVGAAMKFAGVRSGLVGLVVGLSRLTKVYTALKIAWAAGKGLSFLAQAGGAIAAGRAAMAGTAATTVAGTAAGTAGGAAGGGLLGKLFGGGGARAGQMVLPGMEAAGASAAAVFGGAFVAALGIVIQSKVRQMGEEEGGIWEKLSDTQGFINKWGGALNPLGTVANLVKDNFFKASEGVEKTEKAFKGLGGAIAAIKGTGMDALGQYGAKTQTIAERVMKNVGGMKQQFDTLPERVAKSFGGITKIFESGFNKIAGITKLDMAKVMRAMQQGPEKGRQAMGRVLDKTVKNIQDAWSRGEVATKTAMRRLNNIMAMELRLFGELSPEGKHAATMIGAAQGNLSGRQKGGFAGVVPGVGSGDKVPVGAMVEPNEGLFVMNRNAMGALQAINNEFPRFKKGGQVPTFAGQAPGMVDNVGAAAANVVGNELRRFLKRLEAGGAGNAAAMFKEAMRMDKLRQPYLWGGGHAGFSRNGPWDCSGAVSQVLHGAGLPISAPMVSGGFMDYGLPGLGQQGKTGIWANSGHVWMTINGQGFSTSAENPGSGWGTVSYGSRPGFVKRHPDLADAAAPRGKNSRRGQPKDPKAQRGGVVLPGLQKGGRGAVIQDFARAGVDTRASKKAMMALFMAGLHEPGPPGLWDNPGGDRSSKGVLQLLSSTAAGYNINPHNEYEVAKGFLTHGYWGKGGGNRLARTGMGAAMIAHLVQGNATGTGVYAAEAGEASRIIRTQSGLRFPHDVAKWAKGAKGTKGQKGKGKPEEVKFNVDALPIGDKAKQKLKAALKQQKPLTTNADLYGDFAGRAADIEDKVGGKTELEWLILEMNQLWLLRHFLITAHNLVLQAVAEMNEQLFGVGIASKNEDMFGKKKLTKEKAKKLRKQGWTYRKGAWWPPPKVKGKAATDMKAVLGVSNTKLGELQTSLMDVQGNVTPVESTYKQIVDLSSTPAGMFGGRLLEVRQAIKDIGGSENDVENVGFTLEMLKELKYLKDLGLNFAGLFAQGGTLGAGTWGIAGESGPEMVMGPAAVVPAGGGDGAINVRVFIGNRELTDIVRVEQDTRAAADKQRYLARRGRR